MNKDDTALNDSERQARELAKAFSGSCPEERERLSRIVDLLPCYVMVIDKEHRIRFHNRTFEEYFGNAGDMLCHQVLRGQDEACSFCPPFEAFASKGSSVMEWVSAKSKHAFRVYSYPFEDLDGTACVLKAGFNITASVRVQQALDLSEQSYRAITDNLSIGVALIDTNMMVKAGNIRLSQWFAEDFRLDRRICDILQCHDYAGQAGGGNGLPACPECPFIASMKDGASHEKEMSVIFEDGKEHNVRLVTCPVKPAKSAAPNAGVRALIMMLEDITTRLKVNQQLLRARKLEAMSTLAGGIAHEINQPLSALHLYASGLQMLMEKQGNLPAEITQERLSLIMHEADKIRSIISHMRALVMREGRVPVNAVSISSSIDSAVAIMKTQFASRNILVRTEIPQGLPLVRSNMVQLEQVLVNLLANAMHAMDTNREPHQEGVIQIKAYMRPSEHGDAARVRLEVADSGPGLPKGSERIFDPFYTTKERHEGMGLGLSIVYGLVSLWGGEISALPQHPQLGGAVFYVDFHQAEGGDASPEEELPKQLEGVAL